MCFRLSLLRHFRHMGIDFWRMIWPATGSMLISTSSSCRISNSFLASTGITIRPSSSTFLVQIDLFIFLILFFIIWQPSGYRRVSSDCKPFTFLSSKTYSREYPFVSVILLNRSAEKGIPNLLKRRSLTTFSITILSIAFLFS